MNGLEREYSDRITFLTYNIHDPNSLPVMEQFGFTATPELYLVSAGGEILGAWDDLVSAEELRQAFERALSAGR